MPAPESLEGPLQALSGRLGVLLAAVVVGVASVAAAGLLAALGVSLLIQILRYPGCGIA